jgi:RsiW-degrading membrane proteinase PrsW (M82 family)
MFHVLAILGALPALLAMFIIDRADAKRPEPRWSLRRVAIAGGLSTIPAIVMELGLKELGPGQGLAGAFFTGFVVAACVEEPWKALCLWYFAWNRPEFDERTDGIVYGTRAGLGFALVENVGYLLGAKSTPGLLLMFVVRAVLTVPMHAVKGGMMGHFAAWRRFEGRGPGLFGGVAFAIALHGSFDTAILALPTLLEDRRWELIFMAVGCALAAVAFGLLLLKRAWRQALDADDAASFRGAGLYR